MKSALWLLLGLALSGCATNKLSNTDVAQFKRVGVISGLGDQFHVLTVGTTVLTNHATAADVSNWQVDRLAEEIVIGRLSTQDFKTVALPKSDLPSSNDRFEGSAALWAAALDQRLDAVIAIRPVKLRPESLFEPGFGFFERSFLGFSKRCVYASYAVDVYVAASKKMVASAAGMDFPCPLGSSNDIPMRERLSDYSADEQALMHARLSDWLNSTIPKALSQLQLIQATKGTARTEPR